MLEFVSKAGSNPFEVIAERLDKIENLVSRALAKDNPKDQSDIIMMDEIMELTGLARQTIYGHSCRNTMPLKKRGKKIYGSRKELEAWILSGRKKGYQTEGSESLK